MHTDFILLIHINFYRSGLRLTKAV